MITVHSEGDNRYRLKRADGTDVGWVRGRAIGFDGMRTEDDAIGAARCATPVFDIAVRRRYFGWPRRTVGDEELRLVHDGAYEWIAVGAQPLARLLRPRTERSHRGFAIEFVLPSFASEGAAITVAQSIGVALQAYLAAIAGVREDEPALSRALAP